MSDQDGLSKIGAGVPAGHHEAMHEWVTTLNADLPRGEETSQAEKIRQGVRLRLAVAKATGELPDDASVHVQDLEPEQVFERWGLTLDEDEVDA